MRKIIHIDMDCFYAAVETKYRPEFRGRPLAVGGTAEQRSVLCTANYEARKFGVRAAMPTRQALKRCPDLILVPPHFSLYKKESQRIHEIFHEVTELVEPLSLDEAYLDVTDVKDFGGSASKLALHLRKRIWDETKLSASAGIAPNKFLAKIASDWKKPMAQFTITPEQIESLMPGLPVERLWGVGRVTASRLNQQGILTCGDLQKLDALSMRRLFGKRAHEMSQLVRGIDERPVITEQERKSLTVEETYPKDLSSYEDLLNLAPELFQDWRRRMEKAGEKARVRGWVVKLKFSDFQSTTVEESSNRMPGLEDFLPLLRKAYQRQEKPVRLMGLGVRLRDSEPEAEKQLSLEAMSAQGLDGTQNSSNIG